MPDTNGSISGRGDLSARLNPVDVVVSGVPTFKGITAKAILDRDGNVRVTLSAIASYGDPEREATVSEEVDLLDTEVDEALRELVNTHAQRLARKAIHAASQAWQVAIRKEEMEA